MSVELETSKINLNTCVVRDMSVLWLEQDIVVPDSKPDVMKIIRVDGNIFIKETEVMDRTIKISGDITYYVIYLSEENNTRGITVTYPYSKTIDDERAVKSMTVRTRVNIRNIIYSLPNERKISIKSEIMLRYRLDNINCAHILSRIVGVDDLEYKKVHETFFNILEIKNEVFETTEDIMLEETDNVYEILKVTTNIVNIDYKVSYNKILVKGEIEASILYTQDDMPGTVKTEKKNIPFTGMVEFTNISDKSMFNITANLKSLEIEPSIVEGRSNVINISAEVLADVMQYEMIEEEYIEDFYSPTKEISYDMKDKMIVKNTEMHTKTINIRDNIGEIDADMKIVDYNIDLAHLNTKLVGQNVHISGSVKVNTILLNEQSKKTESKIYDALVDESIAIGKDTEEGYIDVVIEVVNAKIISKGGKVESDIELFAKVNVDNVEKLTTPEKVELSDIDTSKLDSMTVYIVKKGDTLWSIAKKYKTTISKIQNTNNIMDENKISIGQKILITR